MKVSNISDKMIVTARDQEIRKKTSAKTSSTGEVTERREANTPTRLTNGQKMLMFNEAIP